MIGFVRVIGFVLFCLFQITSLSAQGQWEIRESHLELGKVIADDQAQTVKFVLKNQGKVPILIKQVTPMSPIFKMHWKHAPILSGETTEIEATFVSAQLPLGHFSYKIIVFSNATNQRIELHLSGQLVDNPQKPELLYKQNIGGLLFKSGHVGLGNLYTWQTIKDTLYFINKRSESVQLRIFQQPAHLKAEFQPSQVAPGEKGALIFTFNASQKNDYGYSFEPLYLIINDDLNFSNKLNISVTLLEDFSRLTEQELTRSPIASFEKQTYDLGQLKKGEKRRCYFRLTNTGKSVLHIRKTKTSCGCTAVRLQKQLLHPGESMPIEIIFDSTGKSGYQNKTITVITNDPRNPETILKIQGEIK